MEDVFILEDNKQPIAVVKTIININVKVAYARFMNLYAAIKTSTVYSRDLREQIELLHKKYAPNTTQQKEQLMCVRTTEMTDYILATSVESAWFTYSLEQALSHMETDIDLFLERFKHYLHDPDYRKYVVFIISTSSTK